MGDIKELDVHSEPGYIIIRRQSGPPVRYPLADLITSADIPDVPIASLTLLTVCANLLMLLIKTLYEREVLEGEDWHDGYDLQYVVETLETNLGSEW